MRYCNWQGFKHAITNVADVFTFKAALALLVCSSNWVFGTDKQAPLVIVVLIFIDTFTGVIKAFKLGHIQSRYFLGFAHKLFVYFLLILTASMVDKVTPIEFAKTIVYTFLAATEALSIVENLAIMGAPIPQGLVKKLKYVAESKKKEVDS